MLETPADGPESEVELDAVLEALVHRRRREVVRVLRTNDEATSKADLARDVVARGSGRFSETYDRVLAELHHCHVPKLAAAGIVSVDDAGRVALSTDDGGAPAVTAALEHSRRPSE